MRREGRYASPLATWRTPRAATERAGRAPPKPGRNADPALAEVRRVAELTKEHERLRRKLATAQTSIDVPQKLCPVLGRPTAEDPEEPS